MGVVNVLSEHITNRDASPRALSNASLSKSELFEAVGKLEVGATDLTGSTYRFCQIPSNAVLHDILLWTDVLDSGAATMAFDLGLYETTENASAVKDVDFFATAILGLITAMNGVRVGHEVLDINKGEKMIWQILGLAADPCKMYDVVATTTGDNDTAGTILLKVQYKI